MHLILMCYRVSLSYHFSRSNDKDHLPRAFFYSCRSLESLCDQGAYELILPYLEASWSYALSDDDKKQLRPILERAHRCVRATMGDNRLLDLIEERLRGILGKIRRDKFISRPPIVRVILRFCDMWCRFPKIHVDSPER